MQATAKEIKELREMTSCGVIECKKALEESNGNVEKAKEVLLKRGLEIAAKKADRTATQGRVDSYIHSGNQIGVLVQVSCETDFVARSESLQVFTRDVALQIAATSPTYIKKEEIPQDVLNGQLDKEGFIAEVCLLEQPFVKDPKKTIQEYLNSIIASIGENIYISRFARYKVNESN